MFTPRSLSIGDHVTTNKELENAECVFGAGHEFTIIDIHYRGDDVFYDLHDRDANVLGDVPPTDIEWKRTDS